MLNIAINTLRRSFNETTKLWGAYEASYKGTPGCYVWKYELDWNQTYWFYPVNNVLVSKNRYGKTYRPCMAGSGIQLQDDHEVVFKIKLGNIVKFNFEEYTTPLTKEEKKEYEEHDKLILDTFKDRLPEKEDSLWYEVLDSLLEDQVLNIIRNRHEARIVGERDSFGWVTKGIEVDGNLMCLM